MVVGVEMVLRIIDSVVDEWMIVLGNDWAVVMLPMDTSVVEMSDTTVPISYPQIMEDNGVEPKSFPEKSYNRWLSNV